MMKIWALADLHLAFGVPSKSMEVFGPRWKNYQQKIHDGWTSKVAAEDLVLLPGDLSWGIHLEEALIDLKWIDALPGTKVILKGNHDYWWPSANKLKAALPSSIHFIYLNAFNWYNTTIGGTRLWDTPEYSYDDFIELQPNPYAKQDTHKKTPEQLLKQKEEDERIFLRELERLELSLKQLSPKATMRIALTHYPPIGPDLQPSRASALLEKYKIDMCIFGHMHNVHKNSLALGKARGVRYIFVAGDYLDFIPQPIMQVH